MSAECREPRSDDWEAKSEEPGVRERKGRNWSRLIAVGFGLTAGCAPGAPQRPVPEPGALRFLLVNDVYVADTLADGTGGLARLATLRKQLEAQGPILFVLAGDVLSPSLLSKYYRGRQMVEAFNAAGLHYATFGNHEFELDRDTLIARIRESRFRWLSANCALADSQPFPGVAAWDTVTLAGMRVGLFGITLLGEYRRYVRCTDPDSAARQAIADLTAAGADWVIGLTHQTVEADSALLEREPKLDLILGGHDHEAHDVTVGGRRVLKADANSRSAWEVTLCARGGATNSPADPWTARLHTVDGRIPVAPEVAGIAQAWQDSLRARLGPERVVGRTTTALDARDAVSRRQESALGDLVTDAIRWGLGSDVAILNAGTLRLDDIIQPGDLTNYQLESIFLFADETRIVTFSLSGLRLRELVERSVSDGVLGKGGFLQISGISFTYDRARRVGSRVVGDLRRPDGSVLRQEDTARVAFGVYPACEGGDGYQVPEAAEACDQWRRSRETKPRAVDLLVRYIKEHLNGQVDAPPQGRIVTVGRV